MPHRIEEPAPNGPPPPLGDKIDTEREFDDDEIVDWEDGHDEGDEDDDDDDDEDEDEDNADLDSEAWDATDEHRFDDDL